MRINTDQLARTLEKSLARAWLIAGDEILLTGEAADAVRARARAEGFSGRELFVTDRNFDWSEIRNASQTLSLFAERQILEIRMPTPRPGKEGAAVLALLAADPGRDTLLLVITTRPEKEVWSSAWLKAFEKHGVFVQSWPVDIKRLPSWIAERDARLCISLERGSGETLGAGGRGSRGVRLGLASPSSAVRPNCSPSAWEATCSPRSRNSRSWRCCSRARDSTSRPYRPRSRTVRATTSSSSAKLHLRGMRR